MNIIIILISKINDHRFVLYLRSLSCATNIISHLYVDHMIERN